MSTGSRSRACRASSRGSARRSRPGACPATGACATLGDGCALIVVEPTPGAPAEKAGLRAEDRIVAVDGVTVDGLTADQALAKVRGPKGTTVTLSDHPSGRRAIRPADRPRGRRPAGGDGAHARRRDRSGTSGCAASATGRRTEFSQAVAADVAAGRTKIVVDLRGNPGGYVLDAQQVVSQFVPAGTTIFSQEDASGARVPTSAVAGGAATDPAIQVAVLIDGGSASAAEIVAGALQDLGRATLVGTKSYGKGTIQVWQQLADDNGGFRLTVAKWLTPNGRWIHRVGLTPDVAVDTTTAKAGSDPVLDRALEVLGTPASGWSRRIAGPPERKVPLALGGPFDYGLPRAKGGDVQ